MVDAALRERALAALEGVTDPEIPVLTIADLGILRDIVRARWRSRGYHNADLLRLSGNECDCTGYRSGACSRRYQGAHTYQPLTGLDDRLAERGRTSKACRLRHRTARAQHVAPGPVWRDQACVSTVRQRRYRTDQRIRLNRVQIIASLSCVPRAIRCIQVSLREACHAETGCYY